MVENEIREDIVRATITVTLPVISADESMLIRSAILDLIQDIENAKAEIRIGEVRTIPTIPIRRSID